MNDAEQDKLITEVRERLARLQELAEQSDRKITSLFEYRGQDRRDLDEVRVSYVPRQAFQEEVKDLRFLIAGNQQQISDLRGTVQKYVGMGIGAVVLIQIIGQVIGGLR